MRPPFPVRKSGVFTTFLRVFPMSPGTRTHPKTNSGWLTAARLKGRRPAFRLPVALSQVARGGEARWARRGSVGEHSGPGRREGDKIIYREVLFTKLLERAALSGGRGELESLFGPSDGIGMGSLVDRAQLRVPVAARALPQAAQCFALAR